MIVTVTKGVVRDGMTSRRGIIPSFYEIADSENVRLGTLDAVSVAQCFRMRLGGVGARRAGQAIDHAAQIAVADRFAMLREFNDGAIDEIVDQEIKPRAWRWGRPYISDPQISQIAQMKSGASCCFPICAICEICGRFFLV